MLYPTTSIVPFGIHTIKLPPPPPFKFALLAWAASVCSTGQFRLPPVSDSPPLPDKGLWTPAQFCPLLECSVLPAHGVEILHQIDQTVKHPGASAPTFALL